MRAGHFFHIENANMTADDIRFEYQVIQLKPAFIGGVTDDALQAALNAAGREGWELVQILYAQNPDLGMRLVCKRAR
ncbi:DUF4177 domain-containing protein [Metallibacterium scheffleri]|uniref:DUF4177 domain-containing protein n=1 Tax=Metallibacterium scheffleri TaxID=993689 RepID=A0A4S3KKC7_9GAMM|nr:DUF4177 domain-containing protein [Metallibacterium scheffleri]THD08818.1 hypothetical protein B1806_12445 [Metallibacterium scheffleri]